MGIKFYKEPELKNPTMFCGWPGIGNIGIYAVDSLREALKAEEFGEIESWDFFNPRKVSIEQGLLKDLEFPGNTFYFQRVRNHDLIFFIGQEQPAEGRVRYSEGKKAYQIANLVLDVAEKFNCQRLYTSGAAVTQIHHTVKPRVWVVPNRQSLVKEIRKHQNTIVMSEVEGRSSQGTITGLNGLLLGVAKERGLDAVCLMGEIPYYLQGAPWPYPKGSKSVLEVLTKILDVKIDLSQLDELAKTVEENIEEFLESLYTTEAIPPQVRDEIEKLRYARPTEPGPITEEEQKEMMKHLDELFREGGRQDEKHL
ncbi:MAG: PAC2 family protein [Planctomycetota bacterium]|jgi:proteasome assembly chaperone (PAC2) family protein